MKKSYVSFVALLLVATLATSCFRARVTTRRTTQEQPATVETKQEPTVREVRRTQTTDRFDIPAPLLDRAEKILVRKAYTASYNDDMRIPNWVAWELTREHATGKVKRPNRAFHEDYDVSAPRATYSDYRDCGWSKGHMCPAGDNKWDSEAMYDTFLLTNICPQDYTLNSGYWNSVEMRCRHWAERYGSVLIVCGPILEGDRHETIGDNHIVVPEAFFKVVVCLEGEPKGIGFICPNTDENLNNEKCVKSISEVESITGIKFFPHLDSKTAEKVKNKADWNAWRR
jgi:endonuclease G